jgi:hypothetical protein
VTAFKTTGEEPMKRIMKMIFTATFVLGASVAIADKLSDFRDAAGRRGCESIPYSDLQSTCKSQQSYVHDYCDGAKGPVTCGSESITHQVKYKLENEKTTVEALKDKRRKLEEEKSRASDDSEKNRLTKEIDQADKDIYDAGRRVEQATSDLDARKKHVEDAIYTIDKCIDYRAAVMNVFATAIDKVRGETDEDIKPYARQLRDKYEEQKPGHEIAITDKKNALETCRKSRP